VARRGRIRWVLDHDDPESVDDLFAENADVHLERMANGYYWLGISVKGVQYDFDLAIIPRRRRIRAFPRQPSPPERKRR